MITLVGVGHVFDIAAQVKQVIRERVPGAVCIELDQERYEALRHPRQRGDVPLPYRLLAFMQRRMAHQYGGAVGNEMLAAADEAKEINAALLLIDAEAGNLFNRLWQEMSFRERVLLMVSSLGGLLMSRKRIDNEIESFQENEATYLEQMGQEFPTIKRVLIDERNQLMGARIMSAETQFGSVVAVVGDGHVDGILSLINRPDVEVIRLKALKEIQVKDVHSGSGTSDAHIQFTVQSE
ncbi:MAG TPA: TraB domain-containing protein [Methanomassiliicoccales archaeon]|jgi:pheromone shutdown protein TraB